MHGGFCCLWYGTHGSPTAELGAGDGSGDGYVERLGGGATLGVVGDEELVGYQVLYLLADAIALVAHDDDAVCCEWLLVDVFPLEKGPIEGCGGIFLADIM